MKKKIVAIMACAMMLLSAGASAEMTAGTYTGEGQGIGGAVKVTVTVEGGAITAVEVVEHAETAGICDPAIEKIPAAIVAAQSLAVDTVTGATVTSKAILAAAEQALTEAGADIEALKTAAPKAEQAEGETIEMTTDVVVVGAGGAGVAAAVEANDNGASVVLLEKLTQIGGTTATSQGMVGGYETKYTKALDVHYTFEEMYGNLMSNASYRLDPEKAGTMGIGFPGSTGEGIMMASNVGAALTHTGDMMCVLKDYEIMAEHDGTSATANVSSFISRDNTVLVGANGKRFVDEKGSVFWSGQLFLKGVQTEAVVDTLI